MYVFKLFGLTPSEALSGEVPDKHAYSHLIKTAVSNRIQSNLNTDCNKCGENESTLPTNLSTGK